MKSNNRYLKSLVVLILLIVSASSLMAQTGKSNIYKFTLQPGFRKSRLDGKTEIYFKKNKKWVIVTLYDITPSFGSAAMDSQNDWNELVLKNFLVKGDVSIESNEQAGWQITARSAVTSIIKNNISLVTFSSYAGHASVLLTNNDFENVLDTEIGNFLSSLSVLSPEEAANYIRQQEQNFQPAMAGNYQPPEMQQPQPTYQMPGLNTNPYDNNQQQERDIQTYPIPGETPNNPIQNVYVPQAAANPYNPLLPTPGEQAVKESVMMDVGWFVEATDDYIQYTKNNIKVVEYFLVETPYPNKDQFWEQFLSRYFATGTYYTDDSQGPSYFSLEFAWANAQYKPNGQNYFIAWLIDYDVPAAFVSITSDESVFRSYFPVNKKLKEMQQFNNFPVDQQSIQGEWTGGNFAGAQMYETTTGNYAGMGMASSANSFTFTGNAFRFFYQGATGMVGTAKTYQIEETGNFTVNGYDMVVNINKRTDQMTNSTIQQPNVVDYYVAFRFTKNSKYLFMQNKKYNGMTYSLFRKQ